MYHIISIFAFVCGKRGTYDFISIITAYRDSEGNNPEDIYRGYEVAKIRYASGIGTCVKACESG